MTDQRLTPQEEQRIRFRCQPASSIYPSRQDCEKLLAEIDRLRATKLGDDDALSRASGLLADECTRVLELREEIDRLRGSLWLTQELADEPCVYGDNCPTFGSRHGTCLHCKARSALAFEPAAPDATVPPRPQESTTKEDR